MKLGQSARKHVLSRSVLVVRMSNISVRDYALRQACHKEPAMSDFGYNDRCCIGMVQ